tara:strand:- start:205 stop:879 length:675 start_codon:yes stop_codon:yes gene_type:complete
MLKNQSNEMATVVETFIINETAELIYDNEQLTKWNDLVTELGLEGQTQIVKKDKSPIPFMHLKKGLQNVLETLCPRKVDVINYNITPIPVEILDLIALSYKEQYFHKIEIWYDDQNPDPCCIGVVYTNWYVKYINLNTPMVSDLTREKAEDLAKRTGGTVGKYDWYHNRYLLGKWADVKHSFDELTKIATERFIAEKGNEFRKAIKVAQRGLDDLETLAVDQFN